MKRWRKASTLSLLAAICLSGCSQSLLSPENAQNAGTGQSPEKPPIVSFAPDGTVDYVPAPVGDAVYEDVNLAISPTKSLSTTVMVEGIHGGMLRAGRFSVKIPAGAFSGSATVTLSMPDSTLMICDLSISPSSANRFRYPAKLTADLSSSGITDASTYTTYWYDPARLTWVNLSARSMTSGSTVTTALEHFSTYGSGKAGW
ncbi:MAG TPA: hypothetical protein VK527_04660 [Candidatus Limnocylindrales bacterium]|nr:hypothetical protein [Candidatus Limnocylindrales bacterium]